MTTEARSKILNIYHSVFTCHVKKIRGNNFVFCYVKGSAAGPGRPGSVSTRVSDSGQLVVARQLRRQHTSITTLFNNRPNIKTTFYISTLTLQMLKIINSMVPTPSQLQIPNTFRYHYIFGSERSPRCKVSVRYKSCLKVSIFIFLIMTSS